MYFVLADRDSLVRQVPKSAVWVEVGVYRGDFSQKIIDLCAPRKLHLVDNWRFDSAEHNPFADVPEHFSGFEGKVHWQHFGDDPNATQEENYRYVTARFAGVSSVEVKRADSIEAIRSFPDAYFDVMYIDANHQYEYILRDLVEARKKLKRGGILLLNDFYEGPGGAEQNLGTIGAVNAFVKRYDFHYLAMSHGAYADLALTDDPGSDFVKAFLANLNDSELTFIGIPDAIVPNIRYKLYRKRNGELRYLALL